MEFQISDLRFEIGYGIRTLAPVSPHISRSTEQKTGSTERTEFGHRVPSAAKPQPKKGVRSQEIARTRRSQETIFGENPELRIQKIASNTCLVVFFCAVCTALLEDHTVSRGFSGRHRLKNSSNHRILNTNYANERQFRTIEPSRKQTFEGGTEFLARRSRN